MKLEPEALPIRWMPLHMILLRYSDAFALVSQRLLGTSWIFMSRLFVGQFVSLKADRFRGSYSRKTHEQIDDAVRQ